MDIYEDARTVSRADLAAWLRQLASQLDASGQVFYGAGGTISVADQVRCELEIEQEGPDEFAIEIEFSWVNPKPAESPKPAEAAAADEAPAPAELSTEAADED
ncbi:amphi-Trp domain-containing protein [Solwaraspora sp. WMMA2101]|uniref:amphi-Trp domain-containing protein n=1 Tax=Solwaraspora sp. WMMA2101 TaxID=3404124 RepID=UPI003B93E3C6